MYIHVCVRLGTCEFKLSADVETHFQGEEWLPKLLTEGVVVTASQSFWPVIIVIRLNS